MSKELEAWGGDVHVPEWIHRLRRHRVEAPDDTPERRHEAEEQARHAQPAVTPKENILRVGGSQLLPKGLPK